jgi:hypothetical protein
MTFSDLATLLRLVADHVEQFDSFEGSIQWSFPESSDAETEVVAVVRTGNSQGQGGYLMIGSVE